MRYSLVKGLRIAAHLLRCLRHSGSVMCFSTLPSPSVSYALHLHYAAKPLAFMLCLLLLTGCAATRNVQQREASTVRVWAPAMRSAEAKNTYRVRLRAAGRDLTGICVTKRVGDEWRGSLVNEFGSKAFDFVTTARRGTLLNVFPMMDRWYIRRTIAADLHFLFEVDNAEATFARRVERSERGDTIVAVSGRWRITATPYDSTVTLVNTRRNIVYELRRMADTDDGSDE